MMSTVQIYLGNFGCDNWSNMIILEIVGFTLAIRRCMGKFVTIRRIKTIKRER